MILLFRMLGVVSFLYLVVFGGFTALVESLEVLRVSGVSSNDFLIAFFRIWVTPFGGLVLAVVCFGVAEMFMEMRALRYALRYRKQPRTAQNISYHIHVPGQDDNHVPPHGIRPVSARSAGAGRAPRTLPGRNVPMREIPLPEQRRRNWVLPGRPHEEARFRSLEHDPNQRYKPKP